MITSQNSIRFSKRVGAAVAVAAACASMSTSAMAGANAELLDLLLKKGVITQEEYQSQKDKAENQDFIIKRLNDNDAKRPIVGIAKEGEPEPIVTFYGIADIGVATMKHSLPISGSFPSSAKPDTQPSVGQASATGMVNGGMQDSRWGIRANLDIGEGRKAFTVLESGINLTTGQLNNALATVENGSNNVNGNSSLNGQLFSRQAYAGVSDPTLGSISFGRQYNFIYDVLTEYDPGLKSDLYSPLGLSGTLGGGGGISEDSRLDNSVKYKNKSGAINYGFIYKFGGANSSASPTSGMAANVGITEGRYGAQLTYGQFDNSVKLSDATTVKLYNTQSWMLAGKYKMTEELTLKGGVQYFTLSTPSTLASSFTNGLNYYGTKFSTVANGIAGGASDQKTSITFFGGDYDINPKTKIALAQYFIEPQKSSDAVQKNGTVSWSTAIVDYRINKYFDVYGAVAYVRWSGDQYSSVSKLNSNSLAGVGLRMKF